MIKRLLFVICDCCEARLEVPEEQIYHSEHEDATSWAEGRNWRTEQDRRHYCPACKVPAKLAKELEAAK